MSFQLANAGDIRGSNRGNGDFDPVSQESNPEAANTMAQLPIGAGAPMRGDGGNRRLYRVDILGNPAAECGAGEHGEQRRICGCQACGGRQGQNRIDRKRAPGVIRGFFLWIYFTEISRK